MEGKGMFIKRNIATRWCIIGLHICLSYLIGLCCYPSVDSQINFTLDQLNLNSSFPRDAPHQVAKQSPDVIKRVVETAFGRPGAKEAGSLHSGGTVGGPSSPAQLRSLSQQHVRQQTRQHQVQNPVQPPHQLEEATAALERRLYEINQKQQMTRSLRQRLEREQQQSSLAVQRLTQVELEQAGDTTALLNQIWHQRQQRSRQSPGTGLDQSAMDYEHQATPGLGLEEKASSCFHEPMTQQGQECSDKPMNAMPEISPDSEEWKRFLTEAMPDISPDSEEWMRCLAEMVRINFTEFAYFRLCDYRRHWPPLVLSFTFLFSPPNHFHPFQDDSSHNKVPMPPGTF